MQRLRHRERNRQNRPRAPSIPRALAGTRCSAALAPAPAVLGLASVAMTRAKWRCALHRSLTAAGAAVPGDIAPRRETRHVLDQGVRIARPEGRVARRLTREVDRRIPSWVRLEARRRHRDDFPPPVSCVSEAARVSRPWLDGPCARAGPCGRRGRLACRDGAGGRPSRQLVRPKTELAASRAWVHEGAESRAGRGPQDRGRPDVADLISSEPPTSAADLRGDLPAGSKDSRDRDTSAERPGWLPRPGRRAEQRSRGRVEIVVHEFEGAWHAGLNAGAAPHAGAPRLRA
jgi:hypothetical protein